MTHYLPKCQFLIWCDIAAKAKVYIKKNGPITHLTSMNKQCWILDFLKMDKILCHVHYMVFLS